MIKEIKRNASQLVNKNTKLIVAGIIMLLPMGLYSFSRIPALISAQVSSLSTADNLIQFALGIIMTVMGYGFIDLIDLAQKNEEIKISGLFNWFSNPVKVILVGIVSAIIVRIGLMLLLIPGIIAAIYFSQVIYVLHEQPELSLTNIFKASANLIKGNVKSYIVLILSFIPWYIVCVITFGIAAIWVYPYFLVAQYFFYQAIRNKQENN